jgi:hypothetical protein
MLRQHGHLTIILRCEHATFAILAKCLDALLLQGIDDCFRFLLSLDHLLLLVILLIASPEIEGPRVQRGVEVGAC